MSHRVEIVNDKTGQKTVVTVIAVEPDQTCELCGKVEETRPYGPGGKRICWDCGQQDKARTENNMNYHLYGKGELQ